MKHTQIIVAMLVMALPAGVMAQEQDSKNETPFCEIFIKGMPRLKGAEVTYERHSGYDIESEGQQGFIQNSSASIKRNRRFNVMLRAPVINHPGLKTALEFNYRVEEFRFNEPEHLTYAFYRELENRPLKKIGGTAYIIKPFRGTTYLFIRGSANLNGDYSKLDLSKSEFLKYSLTPMFGWKLDERTTYAVGLSYGHTFGEMSVYPVISYSRVYNPHWGLDMMLPVFARVRFSPDERMHLYAGAEVDGGNYALHLDDPTFSEKYPVVHLQHSELRLLLAMEREIYDFLWFGLKGGTRTNLRYHLSDADNIEPDILIESKVGQALLLNASLFIVVPKKYAD